MATSIIAQFSKQVWKPCYYPAVRLWFWRWCEPASTSTLMSIWKYLIFCQHPTLCYKICKNKESAPKKNFKPQRGLCVKTWSCEIPEFDVACSKWHPSPVLTLDARHRPLKCQNMWKPNLHSSACFVFIFWRGEKKQRANFVACKPIQAYDWFSLVHLPQKGPLS